MCLFSSRIRALIMKEVSLLVVVVGTPRLGPFLQRSIGKTVMSILAMKFLPIGLWKIDE